MVESVAFSPKGRYALSTSQDKRQPHHLLQRSALGQRLFGQGSSGAVRRACPSPRSLRARALWVEGPTCGKAATWRLFAARTINQRVFGYSREVAVVGRAAGKSRPHAPRERKNREGEVQGGGQEEKTGGAQGPPRRIVSGGGHLPAGP